MNIAQLVYFVEVVSSEFNISTAAEKVHISQSTMSKSIINFENEEQVTLFIRKGKRLVGLTEQGKKFYRDAKKVIRDYDNMILNVHQPQKISGRVKVGIAPAVLSSYFSTILPKFKIMHPDIKIEVFELGGEELQQQLLLRKIDLAYIVAPLKYDSLKSRNLVNDYGAVVYNESVFDLDNNISISNLAKLPLALLNKSFTIRDQLDTLFSYDNVAPNVLISSTSESFLLNAVRTNKLVTVLPRNVLDAYHVDDLKIIPLQQLTWRLVSAIYEKTEDVLVTNVRQIFDEHIIDLN